MRLIDADVFFNDFPKIRFFESASHDYEVEAEPVRHGRWKGGICSECGKYAVWRLIFRGEIVWEDTYAFCPHCGAKMDGERREDADK